MEHVRGTRRRGAGSAHAAGWLAAILFLLVAAVGAKAAEAPGSLAAIGPIIQDEIASGRIPGAVVIVGHDGKIVYRAAFGAAEIRPKFLPLRVDAIFDLASLTKVVATTTAIMQLVEAGRIHLDDRVGAFWPEFAAGGKDQVTVRQLLTHMAGLRPDLTNIEQWSGQQAAVSRVAAERVIHPPGSTFLYSDIGFIALGALVEKITGEPLDRYAAKHIFMPLRMADTGFRLTPHQRSRAVPTDRPAGEVDDPTAFRMGGVAGHAGLFSTADDLARFARMMLNGGSLDGRRILQPTTVALMVSGAGLPGGVRRGLGWDMVSPYAVGLGTEFGPSSFGHTGYTGTSLWIDPATDSFVIILTSRRLLGDRGEVKSLRQRVTHVVATSFGHRILPGIDVLERENFAPLAGKRIGLLTNQAGRDLAGRRTIDVLAAAPGVALKAIFTPEHGLNADREGRVDDGTDGATGLPIHSLYGAVRQPTDAMLSGLDAIVVDLQDVGVRFFTYPSTVGSLLAKAAAAGIEIDVLDRPDPIDAAIVDGPVLDPDLRSFTGYFPMPVEEGMTLGEMALMFNAEYHIGARLTVIPMQSYVRDSWYDATGLSWINPSPNLRSLAAATLYPAVGMIEGANVSVGRGTDRPFELVGAPWIDGVRLAQYLTGRHIAGVAVVPTAFTPAAYAYAGRRCSGIRITVLDRARLELPEFGLELAAAIYRLYPIQFRLDATTALIGSRATAAALAAGTDPRLLPITWQSQLYAFHIMRSKYLLYP